MGTISDQEKTIFNSIPMQDKVQCMYLYLIERGNNMEDVGAKVFGSREQSDSQMVSLIHRCYNFSGRNAGKYAPGCAFEKKHGGYRVSIDDIAAFVREYPSGTYMMGDYSFEDFLESRIQGQQSEPSLGGTYPGGAYSGGNPSGGYSPGGRSSGGAYSGRSYSGGSYSGRRSYGVKGAVARILKIAAAAAVIAAVIWGAIAFIGSRSPKNNRFPVSGKVSEMDKQYAPLTKFYLGNVYYLGQQSWSKPKGMCARWEVHTSGRASLLIGNWSFSKCKGVSAEVAGSRDSSGVVIKKIAVGKYKNSEQNGWIVTAEYDNRQITIANYKNGVAKGNGVLIRDGKVQLYDFGKSKVIGYFSNGQWLSENGKKVSKGAYKSINTTDGNSFVVGKDEYIRIDGESIVYEYDGVSVTGSRNLLTYETTVKNYDVKYTLDTEAKEFKCDWNGEGWSRMKGLDWSGTAND